LNPGFAAIILAAGKSSRMGHCKLLLPFGGTTVIGRVIEVLEAALLPEIIVVVSVKADDVAAEAAKHRVTVARNDIPDGDMVSSLKRGRSLVSPEAAAVLVALADYPLVATSTITTLLDESAKLPGLIVIPCSQWAARASCCNPSAASGWN